MTRGLDQIDAIALRAASVLLYVTPMFTDNRRRAAALCVLLVASAGERAAAQEAEPAASSAAPAAPECLPACRAGFVCVSGQCVSACNPPCGERETCTAAGECVADAPWSPALVVTGHAAPPPVQPNPGKHTHDGLFLRLQAGPGVFAYTPTPARTPAGAGFGFDFSLGGAVTPNLILCGSMVMAVGGTADREPSAVTTLAGLVAAVVYYLPSHFFVGGGAGFGSISVEGPYADSDPLGRAGPGLVLKAEAGREWWVSDDWALGAVLRVFGVRAKEKAAGPYAPIWDGGSVSILFSATYN